MDEESTRTQGGVFVGGNVRPCVGICVRCEKVYIFKSDVPAVRYRGRVYVVVKDSDLLAEVEGV